MCQSVFIERNEGLSTYFKIFGSLPSVSSLSRFLAFLPLSLIQSTQTASFLNPVSNFSVYCSFFAIPGFSELLTFHLTSLTAFPGLVSNPCFFRSQLTLCLFFLLCSWSERFRCVTSSFLFPYQHPSFSRIEIVALIFFF